METKASALCGSCPFPKNLANCVNAYQVLEARFSGCRQIQENEAFFIVFKKRNCNNFHSIVSTLPFNSAVLCAEHAELQRRDRKNLFRHGVDIQWQLRS